MSWQIALSGGNGAIRAVWSIASHWGSWNSWLAPNQIPSVMLHHDSGVEMKTDNKMITVALRFWTNDLALKKGQIIPKHAWTSGMVTMPANKRHGIKRAKPVPFYGPFDLAVKVEEILRRQGIVLHPDRSASRVIKPTPPDAT